MLANGPGLVVQAFFSEKIGEEHGHVLSRPQEQLGEHGLTEQVMIGNDLCSELVPAFQVGDKAVG